MNTIGSIIVLGLFVAAVIACAVGIVNDTAYSNIRCPYSGRRCVGVRCKRFHDCEEVE